MDPPRLASWSSRVSAALLDGLLVLTTALAIGMLIGGPSILVVLLLVTCAYYAGSMARPGHPNGQTLGKQAAGIRVVRDDGAPVTLRTALERDVLYKGLLGPLTLGLDYLWPLGDRERRALHDVAAGTHVVDR